MGCFAEDVKGRRFMSLCHWQVACILVFFFFFPDLLGYHCLKCRDSLSFLSCSSPFHSFSQLRAWFNSNLVHSYLSPSCILFTPCPYRKKKSWMIGEWPYQFPISSSVPLAPQEDLTLWRTFAFYNQLSTKQIALVCMDSQWISGNSHTVSKIYIDKYSVLFIMALFKC